MCNVTLFSCRKQKCQEYKSQKMRFLQMEQIIVSYTQNISMCDMQKIKTYM